MPINQPSNQIKLTNVSLVRLKKAKKRFEIACYKNKVLEYRSGIETDLDNVLQIPSVFINVSKGHTAPAADLAKAFGAQASVDDVIREILNKGELQVGEKERQAQLERIHNEVVSIVASKLVDPKSKRVYTTGMIEKALDMLSAQGSQSKDVTLAKQGVSKVSAITGAEGRIGDQSKPKDYTWTGVVATKSAKSQALDAMRALIAHQPIPVERARMRLRVTCAAKIIKHTIRASSSISESTREDVEPNSKLTIKDKILGFIEQIESQNVSDTDWEVTGFVEPGAFKGLSECIATDTKGQGRVEVLEMAVMHED